MAATILVQKLNLHKQKLLKQVDFLNWQVNDQNLHKLHVLWSYQLQRYKDYTCYHQLSRSVHELAWLLHNLPKCNLFHTRALATLLDKLYDLGLVLTRSLLARALRRLSGPHPSATASCPLCSLSCKWSSLFRLPWPSRSRAKCH
uniref:Uncharacterized protein n=1 Tax=Myotis myotis TaxID=51298 RepID=A0A7J7YDA6_MYOMY|nr:hypothetical protein mMyoMyo1_006815 [Myotis myotis]